jgi:hypothetical protein
MPSQNIKHGKANKGIWLGQQHPSTPREREDLVRIHSKLMAYRAEGRAIATNDDSRQTDVLAVLSKIEGASQQLLSLGYELASAHRTAAAKLGAFAPALVRWKYSKNRMNLRKWASC